MRKRGRDVKRDDARPSWTMRALPAEW